MNTLLYGAIIGDISGSCYEGNRNAIKTKDYKFIRRSGRITDDTVMTVAIADALLMCDGLNEVAIKNSVINSMQSWGRKYPNAGYGHKFTNWLMSDAPQPYKSFGNGAAMRVSAVALIETLYGDLDLVRNVARWTAEVTHNHPEGVKGAEAVASAICLAKENVGKDDIRDFVEYEFGYDLSRTLDEIRPNYRHETSAQKSVPEAIIAFLEAENFEDAIRNAVSLGGDSDTLAAIAGSIAEAFFGVPEEFIDKAREKIPREMLKVIDEVNRIVAMQNKCVKLHGNEQVDLAMRRFYARQSNKVDELLNAIHGRIQADGCFIVAMEKISEDNDNTNFKPIILDHPKINHSFMSVFTNFYEFNKAVRNKGAQLKCVTNRIDNLLESCAQVNATIKNSDGDAKMGLILNPCSDELFALTAELIDLLIKVLTQDFNAEKAQAYKNLVARAKNQYPTYDSKVKVSDADKEKTKEFAATFDDKQDFLNALKSKGIGWNECASDDGINYMRAKMALNTAIACGFDPKDPVALFAPVVDGVNICNEINLYTYQQGFGYAKHTPKIKYLLVAQDWGAFYNADAEPFKEAIVKLNAGEDAPYPVKSVTSKNLVELFKILDRDITKPCADVFFTNFCLGYRLHYDSGADVKKLMMRDAELFRELCEILEPENILCLGKITSECVYEALTGESSQKIYGNAKNYNDFLDNHPQIVLQYGANSELTSNFYPLAHCGGMGTANRPFEKQYNDWAKISDKTPLDEPIEWWWKKNPADDGDALVENTRLAVAVASSFNELDGKKSWDNFIAALGLCSKAGGYVLVPVYSNSKTFHPDDFQFSFMENTDGEKVLEIFATRADISGVYSVYTGKSKVLFVEMREFFKKFLDGEIPCKELLLNICGKNMALSREIICSLQ